MPPQWLKVATLEQVPPGKPYTFEWQGWPLAIHNVAGQIYCVGNMCPHQGRPLDGGAIEGTHLTCPWHAWVFDLKTGLSPYTSSARIPCFPTRLEGTDILVGL